MKSNLKKTEQVPITYKALQDVRSELKSDITSVRLEMKAGFNEVDARFNQVDARFNEVDSKFKKVDARFDQVDARFNQVEASINEVKASVAKVESAVHHVAALVEEQNSRNRIVMDSLTLVLEKHTDHEHRIQNLENSR